MRSVGNWFSFYVHSNIHVALAVYCLTRITLDSHDIYEKRAAGFLFFATIVAYNLIRYVQLERISDLTTNWIRTNRRALLLLNVLALVGMVGYALHFRLSDVLMLLPFAMATGFYALPFSGKGKGLRFIPGLKLYLIAFTWAGLTLLFPLVANEVEIDRRISIEFVQRFLFILAITIPFDIRDLQLDMPELGTLPQVVGIEGSKGVALAAVLGFVILEAWNGPIESPSFWVVLGIGILSALLILKAGRQQNRYYSSFWIEGLPVLWYLLIKLFVY